MLWACVATACVVGYAQGKNLGKGTCGEQLTSSMNVGSL